MVNCIVLDYINVAIIIQAAMQITTFCYMTKESVFLLSIPHSEKEKNIITATEIGKRMTIIMCKSTLSKSDTS